MSVYIEEKAENLHESIASMFNQTVPPDEIVLVKDGPLTEELDKVLEGFVSTGKLVILALSENSGLGIALQEGLKQCKNDIIARMDSDDISLPNRCETQIGLLSHDPELAIVGSPIIEIDEKSGDLLTLRGAPIIHQDILRLTGRRNPMNHSSVMFRKKAVEAAGGYQHFPYHEDYSLWVRMLSKGFKFANTKDPLLHVRVSQNTYNRRGGWEYFKTSVKLLRQMRDLDIIDNSSYVKGFIERIFVRLLTPAIFRRAVIMKMYREKIGKK
jgi:glycosyltransferase involved in cell wall biosynthesis